jgi:hypothetical protein
VRLSLPRLAYLLPLAAAAAALGACQPVRWERPDTDAATQEADTRLCRGYAHRAYRTITEQPLFIPYYVTVRDDKGRRRSIPVVPGRQVGPPPWLPYAPSLAGDRLSLRQDLFEQCLQEKGYRLIPDDAES